VRWSPIRAADYDAVVEATADATIRLPVDILGYRLMPNHFHLVMRSRADGDLGRRLLVVYARRYHRHYHTTGRVWQGRYKAFPV
jgi:putative transposase